jgi:TAG lipase/steryl ester hydrolase/phospholipase A2/LPA acyltransferase
MLQELCEGNRLDETELLDLWVALRAGLAAHAADVAAAALCADEDAGAAARKSAAVTRTVDQLLYEAPDVAGFGLRERAAMLEETLTICGRPALLLSGGGMLGAVHVGAQAKTASQKRIATAQQLTRAHAGVVDALFRAGCLPHVIAGSSAGAIVAAAVCTRNTPELRHFLATWPQQGEPATELFAHFFGALSVGTRLRNLVQTGALYPSEDLRLNLRRLLGDVTFLQAWQHSHRVLAVSVSSTRWGERPRLLHHLSAPHALVWSAVACSCAFPGLYAPQEILALNARGAFVRFNMPEAVVAEPHVTGSRRWRDGSVEADLPEAGLGELFHVSLNIVSQTNPCALSCAVLAPSLLAHCSLACLQGWWWA